MVNMRNKAVFIASFLVVFAFLQVPETFGQSLDSYFYEEIENNRRPTDEYLSPNYEHISHVYWALEKFNLHDDKAIDDFLSINECKLYDRYHINEFEWNKIREIQRVYLKDNADGFSTKLEVMRPIFLGAYNVEQEYFDLNPDSMIEKTSRMNLSINEGREQCGNYEIDTNYPRQMTMYLNRPFKFEKLPVQARLAEAYLEEAKYNLEKKYNHLAPRLKKAAYQRVAYLRLQIRITRFKEQQRILMAGNIQEVAIVFAALEGFEVYADPKKEFLLYKGEIKYAKRKRRNLQSDGAGDGSDQDEEEYEYEDEDDGVE